MLLFEWDASKARANLRKHQVSFEEASTVFGDRLSLTIPADRLYSGDEARFVTLGMSASQKLLLVVHTERGDRIRIISSRKATARERTDYEESE